MKTHASEFGTRLQASLVLFFMALLLLPQASVSAQDPTPMIPDDQVNAIAEEMYCPVCENIPLDVCGTQACHQWRELIRQRLAEGWTEEEIKTYFVEQYGDRVLAEPPRRGFNWLVYILPPAFVGVGAVFVFRVLRRWSRPLDERGSGDRDPLPTVDDDYVRRLEEELNKRA